MRDWLPKMRPYKTPRPPRLFPSSFKPNRAPRLENFVTGVEHRVHRVSWIPVKISFSRTRDHVPSFPLVQEHHPNPSLFLLRSQSIEIGLTGAAGTSTVPAMSLHGIETKTMTSSPSPTAERRASPLAHIPEPRAPPERPLRRPPKVTTDTATPSMHLSHCRKNQRPPPNPSPPQQLAARRRHLLPSGEATGSSTASTSDAAPPFFSNAGDRSAPRYVSSPRDRPISSVRPRLDPADRIDMLAFGPSDLDLMIQICSLIHLSCHVRSTVSAQSAATWKIIS